MGNGDANLMHRANAAPRCGATSKRSGKPCRAPAVTGWTVCRLHGAGGGQRPGKAHPNYRHGDRSREAVASRAFANKLVKEARNLLPQLVLAIKITQSDKTRQSLQGTLEGQDDGSAHSASPQHAE